jgi:hypothetical protein
MTREHLAGDIENVLEMVKSAQRDGVRVEETMQALRGLYRHVSNEDGVPGQVDGCLKESVEHVTVPGQQPDAQQWAHIRACLETALDFARA